MQTNYKKKATKNIIISISFKIILLFIGLLSRIYMVNILGEEITGIYSLYVSILSFLSVAEIGIGSAIVFSMYKPISNNDNDTISALYYLYRKVFLFIFIGVLIIGGILTPLLPYIAKGQTIGSSMYLTFVIFLIGVNISNLYSHKTAFINAHMDNYITNGIRSTFQIIELIVQIILIIVTKSFFLFVVTIFISNLLQWFVFSLVFKNKYKHKINNNKIIDDATSSDLIDKIKAMFIHKLGGLTINTADSVIISSFIGVALLGIYSNYVLIMTSIMGVIGLFFTSIVTVVGHAFANYSKEIVNNEFKKIYTFNFIIGFLFFFGFYAINKELIMMLFNKDVLLEDIDIILLTLNYFIQFMRYTTVSFRDASGTFYNDRYKPLLEGFANITLSIIFVILIGLPGVLIATIITNVLITHVIEPFVLYKHGFEISPKKYYIFNYLGIVLFAGVLLIYNYIPFKDFNSLFTSLLFKGFLSVFITFSLMMLLYIVSSTFRENIKKLFKDFMKLLNRN